MRYLPLIWKNCMRNRRRSILTISSLALSLCVLGVMMAIYHALFLSDAMPEEALRLVTRHKVSLTFAMPSYYAGKIRAVPGVKAVTIGQWFGGLYKEEQRDRSLFFSRFAVEADRVFDVFPEWQIAEEQKRAFQQDRLGCIVGKGLANRLGFKLGDKIVIKGNIFPFDAELTVRGIYDTRLDNESLYMQLKFVEEGLATRQPGRSFAGSFFVLADSKEAVPRVAKEIDAMFESTEAPTRTETEHAFGLSFLSFLGNIKLILMSICGAVTFTILLVAANTMAMSARERIREVGILKTLGFSRETILGLIVGESTLISLAGGALGLAIAAVLCAGIRQTPNMPPQIKALGIDPPVLAVLLGIAVVIGVISSIVPAWSASRTNILDALRVTD